MATRLRKIKIPPLLKGEIGVSCGDCPLPNVIRECAFEAELPKRIWHASHRLTQTLLSDLLISRMQGSTRCLCVWHGGRLFHAEHYWMLTDPSEAGIQHMLGPGCKKCLEDTYLRLEEASGRNVPPAIYEVKWDASVSRKLNDIISAAGKMGTANPNNTDAEAWKAATEEPNPDDEYELF